MRFPSITTQVNVVATVAALFAFSTPNLYANMITTFSKTEIPAIRKYIHVGQTLESLAQAVRVLVTPSRVTSWKTSFVERNLCSVRAMGMKTAMEMRRPRTRETTRRRRIRAFRTWGGQYSAFPLYMIITENTYGILFVGFPQAVEVDETLSLGRRAVHRGNHVQRILHRR
jgi:hypothetical protein